MNSDNKGLTPPYLPVKKIKEMVDLISSRNFAEGITAEFFRSRGFSDNDAPLAVNALKFLNLITEDGTPTEWMEKVRIKGDSRKAEFNNILKIGYKRIFDAVDNPHELSKEKLANEFIAAYRLSDRIVSGAIPAFYKLCEYAGLREEKVIPVAGRRSDLPKRTIARVNSSGGQTGRPRDFKSSLSILPIADGKLSINLPEDWKNRLISDEKIESKWKEARAALKSLVDVLDKVDSETIEKEE